MLALLGLAAVVAGAVAAVLAWSGVVLEADAVALAHVQVGALGGSLARVQARGADGTPVPLRVAGDRITPVHHVLPGERLRVTATVERPRLLAWALGRTRTATRTITAPEAHVAARWPVVAAGAPLTLRFDAPVRAYAAGATHLGRRHTLATPAAQVDAGRRASTGTLRVAAAARAWERLGAPVTVTWFPAAARPAAAVDPAPGADISPLDSIRITFSSTVAAALGGERPTLSPRTPGRWTEPDAHTLVFSPTSSGFGVGGGTVRMHLPKAVALARPGHVTTSGTRTLRWTVPPPSTLRLQQLLAQAGYLPLEWKASGADVPRTRRAQARAAVDAPPGGFSWRFAHTPGELRELWMAGQPNTILRGAIMQFQDRHHLEVDGFAGPDVWRELIADTLAGKRSRTGYSYVYVHRESTPQRMTLWHDGETVLASPGNTGVPKAPTELGTFPVFLHLRSTTMRGTNPDGSKYDDPGVKWVSYFNGGDALHAFDRASYGTPQSVGCVELPEAAAKRIWPYTPIGTLVTIEH
jgi:hypothetical protein